MELCEETADSLVLIEQIYYAVYIDSTSNKIHQHAAGARKDALEADVKQHIGTSASLTPKFTHWLMMKWTW